MVYKHKKKKEKEKEKKDGNYEEIVKNLHSCVRHGYLSSLCGRLRVGVFTENGRKRCNANLKGMAASRV